MDTYEIELIDKAYFQCFGLQWAVNNNKGYAINELAQHTGLRLKYLKDNIEAIKQIPIK